VVEAVLALPSVAERRAGEVVLQRPVGAPQAEAITPVAGGGWRLRVRAEVERRVDAAGEPQRFGVIIQVLVDAQRVPLQVRVLGEVDPEFEALFDD
ncbi:MAG: hypothetical protein P1V36_07550, partial [Planctomycetota bacterium]|nr:hypothetical protein [Planctomycetota bacterium]